MTDNDVHTYYKYSISSHFSAPIGAAAVYVRDDVPAIDTMYDVSSITKNTDVVFRDEKYTDYCSRSWWGNGGSVIGHAKCHSTDSSGRCNKHQVRLHVGWADGKSYTKRMALVNHELGHTFGLEHRKNLRERGVMEPEIGTGTSYTYNRHDQSHLNGL